MSSVIENTMTNGEYEMLRQEALDSSNQIRMIKDSHPDSVFSGMHADDGPITEEEVSHLQAYILAPNSIGYANIKHISIVSGKSISMAWDDTISPPSHIELVDLISSTVSKQLEAAQQILNELTAKLNVANTIDSAEIGEWL